MDRLILAGPPGSGKGTIAQIVKATFPTITHVSTGDLFRDNISKGTDVGILAQDYIKKGQLVPDDVVNQMVYERLGELNFRGFFLDGYPRTPEQAVTLANIFPNKPADAIVYMHAENIQDLVNRVVGRRSCPECKAVYNVIIEQFFSKKDGYCDKCDIPLIQRKDDTEETFMRRLEDFTLHTKPTLDLLLNKFGVPMITINACQAPEAVLEDARVVLQYYR